MASLGAEVFDVDAARLGHAQAKQREETREGMVDGAGGSRLGEEGAELHAIETEGGRLGVDLRPPYVFGRGLGQVAVDDGGAVEANDGRQPSADGGASQVLLLLHPAGIQLDMGPTDGEDLEAHKGAPGEPRPQVAGVAARVFPE